MKNEEKIELLYNEEYLPKEKEQKRTVLLSKVSPKIENFIEKNIKSILYLDIISNCYNTLGYPTIKEIYIEDTSINSIKNDIEKLNIKIDIYSNNTTLYENDYIENTINLLKKSGNCFINEDGLCYKTKKQYDILINANGEYQDKLYKMAYYFKIIANNYYKAYIIDSYPLKINNNSIYIKNIQSTIIDIDYSNINSLKYKILGVKQEDYTLIEDTYIILLQLEDKYQLIPININNLKYFDYNIIDKILEYKSIILKTIEEFNPSIIIDYIYELIKMFIFYYDNVKDDIKERTYIIKFIRKVIDNSLNLLGINPRYI